MKVTYNSETRTDIEFLNGTGLIILHNDHNNSDQLSITFTKGHRNLTKMQNRSDGHSSVEFTKATEKP